MRIQLQNLKGYVMTCRNSMISEGVKRRYCTCYFLVMFVFWLFMVGHLIPFSNFFLFPMWAWSLFYCFRMWPREYLWDDIHQYSLLVRHWVFRLNFASRKLFLRFPPHRPPPPPNRCLLLVWCSTNSATKSNRLNMWCFASKYHGLRSV